MPFDLLLRFDVKKFILAKNRDLPVDVMAVRRYTHILLSPPVPDLSASITFDISERSKISISMRSSHPLTHSPFDSDPFPTSSHKHLCWVKLAFG
jgi:hypothetical protein